MATLVSVSIDNLIATMPTELFDKIAAESESSYRAMLAIPAFARSLTPGRIVDFMIGFDHSVVIEANSIHCCRNGKLHRLDGPASQKHFLKHIVSTDYNMACISNDETWYRDGKLHRDSLLDGTIVPCKIIHRIVKFHRNGRLHCENGNPALITRRRLEWYHNNKCIRPVQKETCKEWWEHGVRIK